MGNYILVPLKTNDRVEEILPRIEEVAQPGMTVIFLIPYQANGFFKNAVSGRNSLVRACQRIEKR